MKATLPALALAVVVGCAAYPLDAFARTSVTGGERTPRHESKPTVIKASDRAAQPLLQGCVLTGSGASAKRWYKGNLHTHTLVSDGRAFPIEAAALYRDAGYHFLMFSDHNRLHECETWVNEKTHARRSFNETAAKRFAQAYPQYAPATRVEADGQVSWRLAPFDETAARVNEPGRFLLMSGCEYHDGIPNASLHCNVINTRRIVHESKNVKGLDAAFEDMYADFLRIANPQDSVFVVNHPIWWFYDVDPRILAKASWDRARFFEVSNNPGPASLLRTKLWADKDLMKVLYDEDKIWDYVLASRLVRKGPILYGTGTDDTHSYDRFYARQKDGREFFRSWVCVRAEELSERALVGAMRRGDFYVANGTVPVELKDVRFEDGTLSLEIDPKPGVEYRILFYGTKRDADLTCPGETAFDLKELCERLKCKKDIPSWVGKSRHVPILPKAAGIVLAESVGTRASYRLKDDDLYVRAKVVTPNGVAWTQPFAAD